MLHESDAELRGVLIQGTPASEALGCDDSVDTVEVMLALSTSSDVAKSSKQGLPTTLSDADSRGTTVVAILDFVSGGN